MEATKPDFYMVRDSESMRFPWIRRSIIVISFLILLAWVAFVSYSAYQDPNVLCFTDKYINLATYVMLGTSVIGLLVYMGSPDSKQKLTSWIRRIPMFWDSIMDSGYTPYFNPDYYEIKNGHYVRVQSSEYKVDHVGLPIVTALTPLNSFNYSIYYRYYKSIIESAKKWKDNTNDDMIRMLRKYLIERSQIVLVGATCMIVKSRSGEHLLIHNSKYTDFIQDQIIITRRSDLDKKRTKALEFQIKYIEGIEHFANRLQDRFVNPPAGYRKDTPLFEHYDQLFNEMIQLNECNNETIIQQLQGVLNELLNSSKIPQSIKSVHSKCLDLNIANAVKNTDNGKLLENEIQSEILNKLNPTDKSNKTEIIFNKLINFVTSKYTKAIEMDPRLIKSKQILNTFINDSEKLKSNLHKKSINNKCEYVTKIKVLPIYDPKRTLGPIIAATNKGYSTVHGVRHAINTIKNTSSSTNSTVMSAIQSLIKSKSSPTAELTSTAKSAVQHANVQLTISATKRDMLLERYNQLTATMETLKKSLASSSSYKNIQDIAKLTQEEQQKAALALEAEKLIHLQIADIQSQAQKIELVVKEIDSHQAKLQKDMLKYITDLGKQTHINEGLTNQLQNCTSSLSRVTAEKLDLQNQLIQLTEINASMSSNNEQNIQIREQQRMQIEANQKKIESINIMIQSKERNINDLTRERDGYEATNKIQLDSINRLKEELERKTSEFESNNAKSEQEAMKLNTALSELQRVNQNLQNTLDANQVMIEAIKKEGDERLQKVVNENKEKTTQVLEQLDTVSSQLLRSQQEKAKYEAELKAKNDEIAQHAIKLQQVKTAAENKAKQVATLSKASYAFLSSLTQTKQQQREEQERQKYEELNKQLMQVKDELAARDHQIKENEKRIIDLQSNKDEAVAIIAALQQKSVQSEEDLIELKRQNDRYIEIQYNLNLLEMANAATANKEQIEQLMMEKEMYHSTLQNNPQETYKNELAELERHREEATRYQLQLETLRNDQKRLETNAAYSNETNAKLKAENTALERSYASLQESLTQQVNELKETYDTNLDQLSQRAYECVKVAKRLKKYDKTGITININKRKPIKVDSIVLDLELIKNLNNQMDAYFNNKASTSLNTFITTFYEPLSNSEPTLLNANSGKIFVFVYSMYKIISNNEKIKKAIKDQINNIKHCGQIKAEQSKILNLCNKFINDGRDLFDNPESMRIVINVNKITYLGDQLKKFKDVADINNIIMTALTNNMFSAVDEGQSQTAIDQTNQPPVQHRSSNSKSKQSHTQHRLSDPRIQPEIPRKSSNPKSQQAKSYSSAPAAFSEPISMTYEERERQKREAASVREIDEDVFLYTPAAPTTEYASPEEVDALLDETTNYRRR